MICECGKPSVNKQALKDVPPSHYEWCGKNYHFIWRSRLA
jgi:hypothetical protein